MEADQAHELDSDIIAQLRSTALFAGIKEADIRRLVAGWEVIWLPHEQSLYGAGEVIERFFVLLEGHVELSVEIEGRRSVVEVARRNAVLGDVAMFSGGRTLMAARALSGARLLAIPVGSFMTELEGRFDVMVQMLATMSMRLRMLVRQIAELKLKNTSQRLGSFLLSLANVRSGKAELRFPYDKRLVADELGMKPESLSRALAKLKSVGVQSRAENVVVVADIGRLRDFCAEDGGDGGKGF